MNLRFTIIFLILFIPATLFAQYTADTTLTIHEHTSFFGSDRYHRDTYLMVINDVFDSSTDKWTVTIDIYGWLRTDDYEDDFNRLKADIHFEKPYKKQVENGTWVKGDSVKNGYWIQYEYGHHITKVCEGFVVNGLRENKWIEYGNGNKKIGEGDYIHGKKEGVWKEWECTSNTSGKEYIYAEQIGTYTNGLKQGEWLEYRYSIKTGEISSIGRKILYRNDTLSGNYKKSYLVRYNKATADCKTCNLLKENLIYISLRGRMTDDIGGLLMRLDSLGLDLYSDKVLRTYEDENGKTQILTVRQHNQYVFSGTWWMKQHGMEGPVVFKNTLIVEKKNGDLTGNDDPIFKKLCDLKFIMKTDAKILCTYTLDADPILETVTVWGLSAEDEASITKKLKMTPRNTASSESRKEYAYYDIKNVSLNEIYTLLKMLNQCSSVKKIYCAQGYIINYSK